MWFTLHSPPLSAAKGQCGLGAKTLVVRCAVDHTLLDKVKIYATKTAHKNTFLTVQSVKLSKCLYIVCNMNNKQKKFTKWHSLAPWYQVLHLRVDKLTCGSRRTSKLQTYYDLIEYAAMMPIKLPTGRRLVQIRSSLNIYNKQINPAVIWCLTTSLNYTQTF